MGAANDLWLRFAVHTPRCTLRYVQPDRFLGVDLLAYRGDATPHNAAAYEEARRDRIRAAADDDGRAQLRRGASHEVSLPLVLTA